MRATWIQVMAGYLGDVESYSLGTPSDEGQGLGFTGLYRVHVSDIKEHGGLPMGDLQLRRLQMLTQFTAH